MTDKKPQSISGRMTVDLNSSRRFIKLAQKDGLSGLAFELTDFDDSTWWNSAPMLHLTEKGFSRRVSVVPHIKAYSNADSVELFVNGVSQGIIKRADLNSAFSTVFIWENVKIEKNRENKITVKAIFSEGNNLEDSAVRTGI